VAYARRGDALVIAAGGRTTLGRANSTSQPTYPGAYDGVLGVGAVDWHGDPAPFAVAGRYVRVAAPGVCILGPALTGVNGPPASGTSLAVSYVSGVAALIRSYYPRMKADDVAQRIISTADLPPDGQERRGGYGIVNPYRAVTALLSDSPGPPASAGVPVGGDRTDPLAATRTNALRIAGTALLLVAGGALAGWLVPRGRRRSWRPGRSPAGW
jgi:subtilisin family serine protease